MFVIQMHINNLYVSSFIDYFYKIYNILNNDGWDMYCVDVVILFR